MARKILLIVLAGAGLATAWLWAATFRGYHGRFVLGNGWQLVVAPARMVVVRDGPGAPQPLRAPLGSVSPPRLRVSPGGGWQAEVPYWIILMATASLGGIALVLPSGGRKEQRCTVCGGRLRQRRCERCHPPVKHSASAF
jgi:hypothetical protein